MTFDEAMNQLKKMGTAQNVKIYTRHGAKAPMFGVSFGNLNKLKKQIKVDHALAQQLWDTGNMDARTLAMMIADPDKLTSSEADKWVTDLDYHMLTDLFASLVARSPHAPKKYPKWMAAKKEFVRQCGYSTFSSFMRENDQPNNAECRKILKTVEAEIHDSPNRARYAMNTAVISIGAYRPELTNEAIAAAKRIGKVEVDHGDTSCRTPDAIEYIKKTVAHLQKKQAVSKHVFHRKLRLFFL